MVCTLRWIRAGRACAWHKSCNVHIPQSETNKQQYNLVTQANTNSPPRAGEQLEHTRVSDCSLRVSQLERTKL